jgi:membrane protease YdiL (CAAX protease family)
VDAYERDLPQYFVRRILAVWLAVTVPMGVLGGVVTPWLGNRLGGRDPFIDALLICFNVGLLWMLALVLILVWREQGSLAWPRVRDALWLRAPRDPRTGRVGGRVWWWLVPVPRAVRRHQRAAHRSHRARDLPAAVLTDRIRDYFNGNWGGFALLMGVTFGSSITEELLFRGLLLPRMRRAFGRGDIVASSVLYTLYHVHQPWSMPACLIDGVINLAYPTRRFRSSWMGIIVHTAPSFLIAGVVLKLVL